MKVEDMIDMVRDHDVRWGYSDRPSPHTMLHSLLALNEEAGEVAGVYKKYDRGDKALSWSETRTKMLEELVDLQIYFAKIMMQLDATGVDFERAWFDKHKVLHKRWDTVEVPCDDWCGVVT